MKEESAEIKVPKRDGKNHGDLLIVIGTETGGPRAISLILSKIPTRSPPIIIVQLKMPEEMIDQWVDRLRKLYPHLQIKIPANGDLIKENHIYIAPSGKHCAIQESRRFKIYIGEKINFLMPAVDVTLISASDVYKENLIGVILTGMGKDGFSGAKKVKERKGTIIAEHASTCVIYGMPKTVIEGKLVDRVVPLHKIPSVLSEFCRV